MFYDPRHEHHGLPHNPWMGLIVPRPIAWISTQSESGFANLAPYSAFNTISSDPPFVMFSSNGVKDSLNNARATGEFCINLASSDFRDAMNLTSAPYAPGIDEFEVAGLTKAACQNIAAPRVKDAAVSIECHVNQIVELKPATDMTCRNHVVIGEVVGIHIDPSVLRDGRVDLELLQPLARLGYHDYCVVGGAFEMTRPALSKG